MTSLPRVLIVDYDPRSLASLRDLFDASGYQVETANDGVAALSVFRELRPSLVLLEAMIPRKHGFEVCQEIKRLPEGKATPVIIMTAVYKGRKYRTQAMHVHGCDEYVERPCTPESILEIVKRFVPPGQIAKAMAVGASRPAPPLAERRGEIIPFPTRGRAATESYSDEAEAEIMSKLDEILPDTPIFDERGLDTASFLGPGQDSGDLEVLDDVDVALEEGEAPLPPRASAYSASPVDRRAPPSTIPLAIPPTPARRRRRAPAGEEGARKSEPFFSRGFLLISGIAIVAILLLLFVLKV